MIQIYVKLGVKDFNCFEEFEQQAVSLMKKYQGKVITAFETVRHADGTGEEIHILEFPSESEFAEYRQDGDLAKLTALREQAVSATEVKVSLRTKSYG